MITTWDCQAEGGVDWRAGYASPTPPRWRGRSGRATAPGDRPSERQRGKVSPSHIASTDPDVSLSTAKARFCHRSTTVVTEISKLSNLPLVKFPESFFCPQVSCQEDSFLLIKSCLSNCTSLTSSNFIEKISVKEVPCVNFLRILFLSACVHCICF